MRLFFFSSRRRHTRWNCDWSSDVCSSDLSADGSHTGQHQEISVKAAVAAPSEAAPEFEISVAATEPVHEAVEEVAISDNPAVTATPVIPAVAKVTSVPSGLFFHGAPPQPAAIASNET